MVQNFKGIQDKEHYSFVSFDIVEFYPSISEQILKTAIEFAAQFTPIPQCDIDVILHARKSLLFCQWQGVGQERQAEPIRCDDGKF